MRALWLWIRKIDPSRDNGISFFFALCRDSMQLLMISIFRREKRRNIEPTRSTLLHEHYYETRTENLMIYRSILSFNLSLLSRTWSPTSVRNLSTVGKLLATKVWFKFLSLSLAFPPRWWFFADWSVESHYYWNKTAMGKRAVPQETDEFQKSTYPTKMFFFRLRPSSTSSSADQSSITELLHFPNPFPPFSRYAEMKLDFRRVWPLL